MSRIYTIRTSGVAVTAVQDLLSILATTGMAFALHEVVIGQVNGTAVNNLAVSIKRLSGTLTAGSAGSAPAVQKMNNGDSAATVTARANDTTQASATTSATLRSDVYNSINTYQYLPPPEDRPVFAPGQQCVISLDTAPSASQTTSVTAVIEELF